MAATRAQLSLDDIADARAYERQRQEFRDRVIALKKIRRVALGPVVSLVFENRETIRFQIQEMARAERLITDDAIQVELDTYNPLIPGPGHLSASLFVELTSKTEMQHWLPLLVGIEKSLYLILGQGESAETVRCEVEADHASHLTRETVTAAVHFVSFSLDATQIQRFRDQPVRVASDHPDYTEQALLAEETKNTLLEDLLG